MQISLNKFGITKENSNQCRKDKAYQSKNNQTYKRNHKKDKYPREGITSNEYTWNYIKVLSIDDVDFGIFITISISHDGQVND